MYLVHLLGVDSSVLHMSASFNCPPRDSKFLIEPGVSSLTEVEED